MVWACFIYCHIFSPWNTSVSGSSLGSLLGYGTWKLKALYISTTAPESMLLFISIILTGWQYVSPYNFSNSSNTILYGQSLWLRPNMPYCHWLTDFLTSWLTSFLTAEMLKSRILALLQGWNFQDKSTIHNCMGLKSGRLRGHFRAMIGPCWDHVWPSSILRLSRTLKFSRLSPHDLTESTWFQAHVYEVSYISGPWWGHVFTLFVPCLA